MDPTHIHQRSTIDPGHEFEFGSDDEHQHGDGGHEEDEEQVNIDEDESDPSDPSALPSNPFDLVIQYQGEVYAFPSVLPEKAQEVLVTLGAKDHTVRPTFYPLTPTFVQPKIETCQRLNTGEREEYLRKYREKRQRRVWGKRITYACRKEIADRMKRHKGQFTSNPEKLAEEKPVPKISACHNCGATSTSMWRKGPDGQRTLCNACGLVWSQKGVMRSPKDQKPQILQTVLYVNSPPNTDTKRGIKKQPQ